ncbi:MAG: methyltransferase type 12 [Devosia sp.]|nr:methyltransferase type 12 [Devosia sp.]
MTLSAAFTAVLPRRHALESKLAFLDLAARDVLDHFPAMLFDSPAYVASGKVFELFRYDLALEVTEANLAATRRWVDYTTALTEHEAPRLVPLLPIRGVSRLLDVGGNSGAFAQALCGAVPDLSVTVLDLPVVVELGRRRVAGSAVAGRIAFAAADMRSDLWPGGHDAICFKSVLHDWPEADVRHLLMRARDNLPAGGRLWVVERGRFDPVAPLPFSAIANLVFSRFYRAPSVYADLMVELGFVDIDTRSIEIDMPFHVISGTRVGRG